MARIVPNSQGEQAVSSSSNNSPAERKDPDITLAGTIADSQVSPAASNPPLEDRNEETSAAPEDQEEEPPATPVKTKRAETPALEENKKTKVGSKLQNKEEETQLLIICKANEASYGAKRGGVNFWTVISEQFSTYRGGKSYVGPSCQRFVTKKVNERRAALAAALKGSGPASTQDELTLAVDAWIGVIDGNEAEKAKPPKPETKKQSAKGKSPAATRKKGKKVEPESADEDDEDSAELHAPKSTKPQVGEIAPMAPAASSSRAGKRKRTEEKVPGDPPVKKSRQNESRARVMDPPPPAFPAKVTRQRRESSAPPVVDLTREGSAKTGALVSAAAAKAASSTARTITRPAPPPSAVGKGKRKRIEAPSTQPRKVLKTNANDWVTTKELEAHTRQLLDHMIGVDHRLRYEIGPGLQNLNDQIQELNAAAQADREQLHEIKRLLRGCEVVGEVVQSGNEAAEKEMGKGQDDGETSGDDPASSSSEAE